VNPDCGRPKAGTLSPTPRRPGELKPMLDSTSSSHCPPLANAFLALIDDGAERDQRSLPRAVVAALAAVALALAVPLGWLAQNPVAVLGPKVHAAALDEEAPA
jgi:hypothetical protein